MSLLNQGFPQPVVSPVALAVAQAVGRPLTGVFGTGTVVDPYAANGFGPAFVADFSAETDDYFRVAGVDSDFETAFTSDSEGGGLATQVDSSGNLVWRAHNLWDNSENLASWSAQNTNVSVSSNTTVAPDGGTTADELIEDFATGIHGALRTDFGPASNATPYYCAVAVKRGSGSRHAQLRIGGQGTGVAWITADLDAGNVGNSGGTALVSSSVTAVGAYFLIEAVWTYPGGGIAEGAELVICENGNDAERPSYAGDGSSSIVFWGMQLSRYDLGGMADVPADQRAVAALTKYVPTTTAAKYLIRRRHYRYNGTSYVPTLLHEPVGATNLCVRNRDLTQSPWATSFGVTAAKTATGIDGQANSASRLSTGSVLGRRYQDITVAADTNTHCVAAFLAKNQSTACRLAVSNFVDTFSSTVDTSDGTVTGDALDFVLDFEDWWFVGRTVTNGGSDTSLRLEIWPDVTGGTASQDVDCIGLFENADLPSSPIVTAASSVTRSADTCKVKAAALPYDSTAMSFAVKGRGNFPDTTDERIFAWTDGSTQRIEFYRARSAGDVLRFAVNTSGSTVNADSASAIVSGAGANVAFRIAGRVNFDANQQQVALDGTAGTQVANTNTVPLVSTGDAGVGQYIPNSIFNLPAGEFDAITGFAADIAEAGIEEALA